MRSMTDREGDLFLAAAMLFMAATCAALFP
jgi:hypothetical protein